MYYLVNFNNIPYLHNASWAFFIRQREVEVSITNHNSSCTFCQISQKDFRLAKIN